MIHKLLSWLSACPYLSGTPQINHTDVTPGSAGLYPQGTQQLSIREDVLGNKIVTYRDRFLLNQVTAMEESVSEAKRLMILENWVREQSLLGLAPQFGDIPGEERIWAEKGKLSGVSSLGTGKFAVQIHIVYQKNYEGSL